MPIKHLNIIYSHSEPAAFNFLKENLKVLKQSGYDTLVIDMNHDIDIDSFIHSINAMEN